MEPASIGTLLEAVRQPFAGFGLAFARCFGMLALLPLATRLGLHGMLRAGVAASLACLLAPALLPAIAADPPAAPRWMLLTAKEALAGTLLGVLFALPFWAAELAGEMVDEQRGSRGAAAPDAASEEQSGITATLIALTLITLFLLQGGMHLLIEALMASYRAWPAMQLAPTLAADTPRQLLGLLDAALRAGFVLAFPLLAAMLLAELSLALISRFAPQLNVFDLAMAVKGLVHVIGLPVYAVFLLSYLRDGLAPLAQFEALLRRLLP